MVARCGREADAFISAEWDPHSANAWLKVHKEFFEFNEHKQFLNCIKLDKNGIPDLRRMKDKCSNIRKEVKSHKDTGNLSKYDGEMSKIFKIVETIEKEYED